MKNNSTRFWQRAGVIVGTGALLIGALAGCAGGNTPESAESGTQADIDAAVEKGATLTWWTWSDSTEKLAEEFTKENPNVKIKVVKMENPDAVVTKLQNAIKAGSGAPDILGAEYQTLPQLALGGALADMSKFGLDSYENEFTASTWNSSHFGDQLVAIPGDSGPMVMIYNKTMYDAAGITEAPKTWDEFAAASTAIHAADPEAYIANSGDAGFITSMLWSAGAQPFKTDGENITIDLQDEGSKKFADYWGGLLQNGELSPLPTWSDEWSKALSQNKLATLLMGSWMISGMDDYSTGNWRVAPMPSWDGTGASAQNGGSGYAVSSQSKNKAASAAVLQFLADGTGRDMLNASGFPSTLAAFENPEWRDFAFPAYDGQEANQVGVAASESVIPGWQYLPYQGYANNVFTDSVGKALGEQGDLNAAFVEWQKTLVEYGNSQGFSVNK